MSELSAARFELARRWRVDAGDFVTALEVSPSGDALAIGTAGGVVMSVRASDGEVAWRRTAIAMGVQSAHWSADGAQLAVGGQDRFARVLARATGEELLKLDGGGGWVEQVRWAPSGGLLATAAGKRVRFWDREGRPMFETPPQASTVTAIAWRSDGRELASACYGGVHFWSPSRGLSARQLEWKGSLLSLAWSPNDAVLAASSQDCTVHFWRLPSGRDSEMSGYPFKPKALAWDSRSTLLATGGDRSILLWNFSGKGPEGTTPTELSAHRALVTELSFHRTRGVLASGAEDTSVILWDPRKAGPIGYAFGEERVSALRWSLSGELLIVGDASGAVSAFAVPTHAQR